VALRSHLPPVKAPEFRAVAATLHAAPTAGGVLAAVEEQPTAIAAAWTPLDPVEPIGFEQRDGLARDLPADDVETAG